MRRLTIPSLLAILLVTGGATPARASSITFDFNSLASGTPSSGGVGPTASIQNYMDSLLGCSCVTVTGGVADRTYNGEGFVVGPGTGSKSLTLGTSDGATASNSNSVLNAGYDTFIANTNDQSSQISNQIKITFIGGYQVNGPIGFDYEIFPDGTANQPPDFIFKALSGASVVGTWTTLGVTPGTTDGTATHSPNSGSGHAESNQQYIGTWSSGPLSNVTELQFIDWPATVAIDNLTLPGTGSGSGSGQTLVPEPTSLLLLGSGLAMSAYRKRRKKS